VSRSVLLVNNARHNAAAVTDYLRDALLYWPADRQTSMSACEMTKVLMTVTAMQFYPPNSDISSNHLCN